MANERCIKTIERADGKARLFIFGRDDGRYRYEGEAEQQEDGDVFVAPDGVSGLFESAEAAEQNAAVEVPWLRRQLLRLG
jgi:hypothetical protein